MSYQLERSSIEAFFSAQWGVTTQIGYDGQAFTPPKDADGIPVPSVRLTINSGEQLQYSIGRASDTVLCVGMLVVTIYTAGGKGSAAWRALAETATNILRNKTLDTSGAVITNTADAFVRFSPVGVNGGAPQHPYISASFADAPFHITNVTAPFTRYDFT